ncbi:MAG: hypothetical protein IT338_02475 [Thermomicrobiales bacterium]|nr:hypothetical protein [Thermomicrobiales bacterium]
MARRGVHRRRHGDGHHLGLAAAFGMRRLSLLSVFDNPREGAHLGLTEAHKDEARVAGERPCSPSSST